MVVFFCRSASLGSSILVAFNQCRVDDVGGWAGWALALNYT